jgi:hypothetical protein
MWQCVAIVGAAGVLAACASAGGAGAHSGCGLSTRDSTYLSRGAVYRDCAVDEKARLLTTNARPDFQPSSSDNGCIAAEVEFVVDTAGVPELGSQRLVRATKQPFGDAVLAMVTTLRYEPARLAGVRVRQIVSERRTVMVSNVLVPKGSGPPTRGGSQRAPNC